MATAPDSIPTGLDARRRREILARYSAYARRFDSVARRRGGRQDEVKPVPAREVDPRGRLSPRLEQALALTAEGLTNVEIAGRMGISEETVKTHQRNLLRLLGAKNRAHAVAIGFRQGTLAGAGDGSDVL
jgi:DNA-binding CsgD family transcriptional regulator